MGCVRRPSGAASCWSPLPGIRSSCPGRLLEPGLWLGLPAPTIGASSGSDLMTPTVRQKSASFARPIRVGPGGGEGGDHHAQGRTLCSSRCSPCGVGGVEVLSSATMVGAVKAGLTRRMILACSIRPCWVPAAAHQVTSRWSFTWGLPSSVAGRGYSVATADETSGCRSLPSRRLIEHANMVVHVGLGVVANCVDRGSGSCPSGAVDDLVAAGLFDSFVVGAERKLGGGVGHERSRWAGCLVHRVVGGAAACGGELACDLALDCSARCWGRNRLRRGRRRR